MRAASAGFERGCRSMNLNITLVIQLVVFVILGWITMKFVWPPLIAAIEARQRKIAEGLVSAEKAEKSLAEAKASATDIIKEARVQANKIVEQANRRSNELVEEARGTAIAEGQRLLADARKEVTLESNRAREQLRREVALIAVAGAGKLLGREVDANAHADLLENSRSRSSGAEGAHRHGRESHSRKTLRQGGLRGARESKAFRALVGDARSCGDARAGRARCQAAVEPARAAERAGRAHRRSERRGLERGPQFPRARWRRTAGSACCRRSPRSTRSCVRKSRTSPTCTSLRPCELNDAQRARLAAALQEATEARSAPALRGRWGADRRRDRARGRLRHRRLAQGAARAADERRRSCKDQRVMDMAIKASEISDLIKARIEKFASATEERNIGTVVTVTDGIVRIHGLADAKYGEMLEFPGGSFGLALNLEQDSVGAVVLGEYKHIVEGDTVKTTGRILEVPVGEGLLGRVVDSLGKPIDGKGPIKADHNSPIERVAPGVVFRKSGEPAGADRLQGGRLDGADRPRPARADHRRPSDRQDRARDRHDHQSEAQRHQMHLRRDRAEAELDRQRRAQARRARRDEAHDHRRRLGLRCPPRCSISRRTPAARWASSSWTAAKMR